MTSFLTWPLFVSWWFLRSFLEIFPLVWLVLPGRALCCHLWVCTLPLVPVEEAGTNWSHFLWGYIFCLSGKYRRNCPTGIFGRWRGIAFGRMTRYLWTVSTNKQREKDEQQIEAVNLLKSWMLLSQKDLHVWRWITFTLVW